MSIAKAAALTGLVLLGLAAAGAAWLYTPDASRAALEAKYGVAPTDYLSVAGLRLHVSDRGPKTAPAIILLHGFGASLQTFDAWAAALEANHRVIAYDLPGFGLTGADPSGDYSDERGMAVLGALMDRLGLARASLVGHSMGGRLAWQFAAAHPERVERLALLAPDGYASPGFDYGKAPDVPFMVRMLPYVLPRALVRMSLAPAYGDPARLDEAVLTRYRDMMLAPGVRAAMVDRMRQTVLQPPEPVLRRIVAPTLLLWGERDGMIPVANAQDYARAIGRNSIVVLPGLGHVPQEEAPVQALEPLAAFLSAPEP